jgi:NTE family protein
MDSDLNENTFHSDRLELLRRIEDFSELDSDLLSRMVDLATYKDVARGEALIRQGDPADQLHIVLKGRFVVMADDRAIAEIALGEPIGELAFFAGGTRTATVIAARDSMVMSLSRAAYETLSAQTPALANGILASVSARLARAAPSHQKMNPQAGQVAALLPCGSNDLPPALIDGLKKAFLAHPDWHVIEASACPDGAHKDAAALAGWLSEQEARRGRLFLIGADDREGSVWKDVVGNVSDCVFFAMDATASDHAASQSDLDVLNATLQQNLHLVLCRKTGAQAITGTARILDAWPVGMHHHVALDQPREFDRLARFIMGRAIGLVMCGGGSFGTAHLGVIKALQTRGYDFDFVGGTSVGAAMAGAVAMGLPPDEIMDRCEDIFLTSKAMSRLTVPRYSLLDHRALDQAFLKHYGTRNVEDLPINYFAVSTSLTENDSTIIRSGPLWKAIRASSALPGIFPPMFKADGEVLVDGGLIDNAPLRVMRTLKAGPNVMLNFVPAREWRVHAPYDGLPGRLASLWHFVRPPKRGKPRYPNAFSVLTRAIMVNARKLTDETEVGKDVIMNISVLKGMSFMDWKRGRELFQSAEAEVSQALDAIDHPDGFEALRLAAEVINEE